MMQNLLHKVMNIPNDEVFKVVGKSKKLTEEETKEENKTEENKEETKEENKPEENKPEETKEENKTEETKEETKEENKPEDSSMNEPTRTEESKDIPGLIPIQTFQKIDNLIDALVDNSGRSSYSKIFFERIQDISNIIDYSLKDTPIKQPKGETESSETEVKIEDGDGK